MKFEPLVSPVSVPGMLTGDALSDHSTEPAFTSAICAVASRVLPAVRAAFSGNRDWTNPGVTLMTAEAAAEGSPLSRAMI